VTRQGTGVSEGLISGWRAVRLTTDALSVTVLPDKGADIYQIIDRASGVDPLFKAPWGLQPHGASPRAGSEGAPFLENYEGSWQELFPNTNDACTYQGTPLEFHGEVATRPWDCVTEADDSTQAAVRLSIACRTVPLRLDRIMRVYHGTRELVLEERVTNTSPAAVDFVWGHHCVLGAPLIASGAELRAPAATIITPPEPWEDTARLKPGQRAAWPMARLRDGGMTDLTRVPGPEAASHDDVYLTDLAGGWVEVGHSELGLGFRLAFDHGVFGWIISWQPYGGTRTMPLRGAYALGIEPWVFGGNLQEALDAGSALRIDGHGTLETRLTASIRPW